MKAKDMIVYMVYRMLKSQKGIARKGALIHRKDVFELTGNVTLGNWAVVSGDTEIDCVIDEKSAKLKLERIGRDIESLREIRRLIVDALKAIDE